MWLKLNLTGMKFDLKIDKYVDVTKYEKDTDEYDDAFDGWAQVSYNFEFKDIIKYSEKEAEVFENGDIDYIRDEIEKLLKDEISEDKTLGFAEPDFDFVLMPKYDIRNNPNVLYVRPGMEIRDILIKMKVNLWNNGLTDNYFSTTLGRNDIEDLYVYLLYMTNRITSDDERVKERIKNGIFSENE